MPENRQVKRNVGEALRRLKIQTSEKQDGDVDLSSLYPDRPGEPDCDFYLKTGRCGYGATCRFNHPSNLAKISQVGGELPERDGEPDCGYFMKTGTCKYRSSCKFNHPPDRHGAGPVVFNNFGLPLRQEEKSCPHYMRTGECKFGTACKFNHPQELKKSLAYAGNALPVPGTVAGGPPGLIIIPSSALSYAGGIPSWPPHRDTYLFNPQSQGLGWETYMVTPPSTTVNNLPERRDQPECRHFMNTGSCKYGSDCKYNHPREKILQLATSTLGPLGLPFRPGQAICSYYRTHGSCKFGPTCKYDHPFLGYPYNYGMNYNTLYVPDPSSFPPPMIHSYETYPSMSPKLSDSVGKVDVQRKQRTNVEAAEESPEPAESLSHSLST